MSRISVVSLAAALVLCRLGWAGEEPAKEGKCCVGAASEKIAKLLVSWKAASEEAKTACADERTKLEAKFAGLVKECPIGSRMGETLGFVKSTLAAALKANEACAEKCAKSDSKESTAAEPACEGAKILAARTKLLTSLNELATFAAGTTCGACSKEGDKAVATSAKASFCEKKAASIIAMIRKEECDKGAASILMKEIEGLKCEVKAGEIVAAIRAEKCDEGAAKLVVKAANELLTSASSLTAVTAGSAKASACCAGGGACCLGSKAAALKASWEKAPAEFASMCPQKKKELMASMSEISSKSKAVALIPETVAALGEGFDALEGLNAKLADFAKANPDAVKNASGDAKKAVECQNALIHDGAEVLHRVLATMKPCAGECPAKKTETAAN